jgi:hypothetical protein
VSTIAATNLKNPSSGSNNVVLNADGSIGGTCLTQTCRAWVNFNGTGTVAIRASYNVSSITDNGVGDYTVNFTTAMVDANYAVALASLSLNTSGNHDQAFQILGTFSTGATTKTASALRVNSGTITAAGNSDNADLSVSVFR